MTFEDRVKSYRERHSWSQGQLGAEIGVDQATVSRLERGAPVAKTVRILLERMLDEDEARLASASASS